MEFKNQYNFYTGYSWGNSPLINQHERAIKTAEDGLIELFYGPEKKEFKEIDKEIDNMPTDELHSNYFISMPYDIQRMLYKQALEHEVIALKRQNKKCERKLNLLLGNGHRRNIENRLDDIKEEYRAYIRELKNENDKLRQQNAKLENDMRQGIHPDTEKLKEEIKRLRIIDSLKPDVAELKLALEKSRFTNGVLMQRLSKYEKL